MKILFITNKYGDLGNRLFRYARLYSVTSENKILLIDLSLYQYAYSFTPTCPTQYIINLLLKLLNKESFKKISAYIKDCRFIDHITTSQKCETQLTSIIIKIKSSKSLFFSIDCCEIMHCNYNLSYQQRKTLAAYFNHNNKIKKEANSVFKDKKNEYIYLGVHIRRGDYKYFGDGKYYLDFCEYEKNIDALMRTNSHERSIKIVIVSDEKIDAKLIKKYNPIYHRNSTPSIDQELLIRCDYIIGVYSSFSAWPSFVHTIPIALINPNKIIKWSDFKVCDLFYKSNY